MAAGMSPMSLPQSSKGRFEVMIIDRVSYRRMTISKRYSPDRWDGSTIRAKHLGKDILAGLRMLVGGEIKEYTEMLVEARNESLRRMQAQAEELGADAVINVRFVTSQVMTGAAELLSYGTAVKLTSEE